MNINTFLGLDPFDTDRTGRRWEHGEIYSAIVNAIGFKKVRSLLPFKAKEFAAAFVTDPHLNYGSLPIRSFSWDEAGGCRAIHGGGTVRYIVTRTPLTDMCKEIGITSLSPADGVCILKQCARMLVETEVA